MVDYTNCDTERLAKTCITQRITAAINEATEQLQRERDELENERYKLQADNKCLEDELVSLRVFKSPAQLEVEQERDTLKRENERLREALREILIPVAVICTTDKHMPYLEIGEDLRRALRDSHDKALITLNPPVEGGTP